MLTQRRNAVEAGNPVKNIIKRGVKYCAATVGNFYPKRRGCSRILTYHSIGYRDHEMNVTPENFQAQMAWLAKNLQVISLDEAAEGTEGVAVTFDDGYRDHWVNAAPILQRFSSQPPSLSWPAAWAKICRTTTTPSPVSFLTWGKRTIRSRFRHRRPSQYATPASPNSPRASNAENRQVLPAIIQKRLGEPPRVRLSLRLYFSITTTCPRSFSRNSASPLP